MKKDKIITPICIDCKYSTRHAVTDTYAIYGCKFHKKVDPIIGVETYPNCADFNSKGECQDWERGGLIRFLQRLFK